MSPTILPTDESSRTAILHELELLDTEPEECFDRITRIAQRLFGVPIALLCLLDRERAWFKSRQGFDLQEIPRDLSICAQAILADQPLVIPDLRLDPRFADSPLTKEPLHFRFYAGQPLKAGGNTRIGTLCLIDREPRAFPEDQQRALQELGAWAESEFSLKRTQKREELDRNLRQSEAKLKVIFNGAIDGLITIDSKGIIESVNPAIEKIFGYTAEQLIGKNVHVLIPSPLRSAHDEYLRKYQATGDQSILRRVREEIGQRKDGSKFPMELAINELNLDSERFFIGSIRDITARRRAEEERRRFFNLSLDLMCIAGFDGYFKDLNPLWTETLGYSIDELKSKPYLDFVHPEDRDRSIEEIGRLLEGGTSPVSFENRYRCKDGSYRWFLWSATIEKENRLIYAIARNITDRIEIEKMKTEFVSIVSHELRTPLTSILGSLDLLVGGMTGSLSPETHELLDIAFKNSERLSRLINDILDIEKIESGAVKSQNKPLELASIVRQAIRSNRAYGARMNVEFELERAVDGVLVNANGDWLLQVMTNLLSNAAKFSPPGEKVTVWMEVVDQKIRVSVEDRGPGIPEDFKKRIFQKFAQADSSDSRQKNGTGLGLSISRAIIERLHGTIGFETRANSGSTFFFDLPIWKSTPPLAANPLNALRQLPRILVCENNRNVAALLGLMLSQAGFEVLHAYNAHEVKEQLLGKHFDAMTLDLVLPDQDGTLLLQELWARHGSLPPIIIVSVNAQDQKEQMLLGDRICIVDWLTKPINEERLLKAARKAIHGESRQFQPKILYVEDDTDLVHILQALVHDLADVVHCGTLAEAILQLPKEQWNLILMDTELPDGSGLDLVHELSQNRNSIPIVIFSAQDLPPNANLEVAAALTKSTTSNQQLLETIKALLLAS